MLLWLALSRTREFDADAGAAALTSDPDALAAALRRLDSAAGRHWETLSRGVPAALSRWLGTHPRVEERIARLRELAPERRRILTIPWWPSLTPRYRTPTVPWALFGDVP